MARRFNPPPGWPKPPPGWLPPDGWQPDPAWPLMPPGWQLVVEDADPAETAVLTGTPAKLATAWYARRWLQLLAVGLLGLLVGAGIGSGNASQAQQQAAAASKVASQAQAEAAQARQQAAAADQRAAAQLKAQEDAFAAKQKAAEQALAAREAAVAKGENTLASAQAAAKASSFAGDGTYLVGTDIQPGTYRAAASPGCYWARLRSLNTSDIIDNGNTVGPVVLQVLPTDKAVQVSGCAKFNKIG